MKYLAMFLTALVILISIVLTGCSSDDSNVKELKSENRELSMNLQSCQNRLSMYTTTGSSSSSQEETVEEPAAPQEPQYETVIYYEVDGTKCYNTNKSDQNESYPASTGDVPSCGRSFWDCKDGVVRECMVNVKYKEKEEKRLVKEEEN